MKIYLNMHEIIILLITYVAVLGDILGSHFTLILKELEVFKYVKIGYLEFIFNNNRNYSFITKTYNTLKYYHNYNLPVIHDN